MINPLKKTRFFYVLAYAFWQKQKKLIILSSLVGIVCFILLPKIFYILLTRQEQRIGLVGKFSSTELPLEIQHLLSDGLTRLEKDGSVSPGLADSWEVSSDGKEYIFILKDNLFWQDGKPVKAADINYNFSDVAAQVIDEKKIKFSLKEPFSPFPVIVSRPIFKKGLIGAGKYQIKAIKKNGQTVEQLKLSPKLTFRFYPTEAAARTAFKLGEIDVISQLGSPGELEF